jgi:hypothetical protein
MVTLTLGAGHLALDDFGCASRPRRDNQAVRTAWRIIREWVQSQLALVEVNMATISQIFLPYACAMGARLLSMPRLTRHSY